MDLHTISRERQIQVRRHVQLAQDFAGWIETADQFELAAPTPLNLICFRHVGGDEINRQLMEHLNRSGDLYLTHTSLNDQFVLRFCVGQTYTEERHVKRAWERIVEISGDLER